MKTKKRMTYLEKRLEDPKFREGFERELVYASISEKLAKRRYQAKMTQDQVAKKMHTTKSVISRLESGTYRGFSVTTLSKYAKAVGAEIKFNLVTPKKRSHSDRLQAV